MIITAIVLLLVKGNNRKVFDNLRKLSQAHGSAIAMISISTVFFLRLYQ